MTYTTEFEYSVVGAVVIDSRTVDKLSSILAAEDFTITACATVYEAAQRAQSAGKTLDPVYAASALKGVLDEPMPFIMQCMDLCPSVETAPGHAKEIHKQAELRRFREKIKGKLSITDVGDIDPNDLAADLATICQDHLVAGRSKRYSTMLQAAGKVYERVTAPTQELKIQTGFTRLDSMLKGLPKDSLTFIGARPSVGKSAFALNIAEHIAATNGTVMLYSLEMDAEELAERSMARYSGVTMDELIDGNILQEKSAGLARSCAELGNLPINIFDTPNVTPAAIRRDARMFKDLQVIIIDFISLMQSDRKSADNRNLELGAISRDLKNLTKELKVPIVCLSQLSRNSDEKTEPVLSSLRDSGELEQNASKVIFLWQLTEMENNIKEIGVSVAKNRRGRKGAVRMYFDGSRMNFTEIDFLDRDAIKPPSKRKYGTGIAD